MRRLSEASFAASTPGTGAHWSLFGLACLCILGLAALVCTGARAAGTATDACPNSMVRAQQRSLFLPNCRAYEQVTPSAKNGNSTIVIRVPTAYPIWPSRDGETVITYVRAGAQGEAPARGAGLPLASERTPDGWVSRNATPGFAKGVTISAQRIDLRRIVAAADAKSLMVASTLPFSPDAPGPSVSILRGETVEWASRPTWPGAPPLTDPLFSAFDYFTPVGGSEDLSTVYFDAIPQLTAEDAGRPEDVTQLYRYENGALAPVPLPDGSAPPEGSVDAGFVPPVGSMTLYSGGAKQAYSRPVSADGKTVTFLSPNPTGGAAAALYISHVGEPTRQLSPIGTALPVGAIRGFTVSYAVSSSDGRYVVFASTADLTPAAEADPPGTRKIYRYDRTEPGSLTYLPELTMANADMSGIGPVLAVSPDGSRILFGTEAGEVKLWRSGMPTLTVAGEGYADGVILVANFSGDESALVLMASAPLGGAAQEPGTTQVYRFAEATSHLDCLSCLAGDTTSSAKFNNWVLEGLPGAAMSNVTMRGSLGISKDGDAVFFDTTAKLVPEDHNEVSDVYEWSDGAYGLISSGLAGETPSFFADNDPTGRDVYFYTRRNIGADQDDLYDLYDARIDGGFLESPPTGTGACRGEQCQGALRAPPVTLTAASTALAGSGNRSRRGHVRKRLVARPGRVVLKVRTPAAGRIVVWSPSTKTAVRGVAGAGTARLTLQLTKAAQRQLSSKGHIDFKARVSFTPTEGAASSDTVAISVAPRSRKGL